MAFSPGGDGTTPAKAALKSGFGMRGVSTMMGTSDIECAQRQIARYAVAQADLDNQVSLKRRGQRRHNAQQSVDAMPGARAPIGLPP
jgi:hypothetical protein